MKYPKQVFITIDKSKGKEKWKCTHVGAVEATAKREKERWTHSVIIFGLLRFPMLKYTVPEVK